jgi:16S rRNA (uracil1498-N3)-methyltransferase
MAQLWLNYGSAMAQLQRLTVQPQQIQGTRIDLTTAQWHYLHRVLRLHPGDRFIAMNGQGDWWLSLLGDRVAEILEPIAAKTELPIAITLLVALPKNGMDDIVRQATELGVERIQPVISDRTLLKPSPQKGDRWQRIAQEAAEQSERQIVPTVLPPIAWREALQIWGAGYLCEARGDYPHLLQILPTPLPHTLTLATGPEGGWTDAEIQLAIAAQYQPVSLGPRIFRAVTAPLVALSLIGAAWDVRPGDPGNNEEKPVP